VSVVGGLGGVFRMLTPPAGACADSTWTKYGQGLPDVVVHDVVYDATTDTLVAGTLGRGAWTVANASATLAVSGVLTVTGDANPSNMELRVDPHNPLRIQVSDGLGNRQSFDPAELSRVAFQGLGGADSIFIGSNGAAGPGGSVGFVTFLVSVDDGGQPGDKLTLEDGSASTSARVTVTSTTVGAASGDTFFGDCGRLSYAGLGKLTLDLSNASAVGDTAIVQGTAAGTATVVNGNAGSNLLQVIGKAGGTTTWVNSGANSGTVSGGVTFSGMKNLKGGANEDVFTFGAAGSLTGTVNGGGGTDWLDYRAKATAVAVNLVAHTASYTGGVFDIRNVLGSAVGSNTLVGSNLGGVLVGFGAGNTLVNGGGPGVLIGGYGKSLILGGSGNNLEVAGSTVYDNYTADLDRIFAEWSRAIPYAQRVADLRSGAGLAAGRHLILGQTVFVAPIPGGQRGSTLVGGSPGLNWFFASAQEVVDWKRGAEYLN
jgi:hypothetical protein